MLKKILKIIIILLVVGAGVLAYFYFFSPKKADIAKDGLSLNDLFPFGDNGTNPKGTPTPTKPINENPLPIEPAEPSKPPKLVMVTRGPVAGASVFDVTREKPRDITKIGIDGKPLPIETEPATKVRYIEVSTGHTNETYLDKIELNKITNTTIPKITEGYFAGKGSSTAILRYADDSNIIQTYTGTIPLLPNKDGTPDTNLRGTYLSEDITAMAVSPEKDKIFTIAKTDTGSIGTISLPDGTKKSQLFSLNYSEWAVQWPNIKTITITTKPSVKVSGYSYTLDVATKSMKKIIGGVFGLTTLTSPDLKNVLFARSANNNFTSSLYNIKAKSVFPLPGTTTMPEKCVWQSNTILYCAVPSYIPNGDYPDVWYQGGVSFVDQIYKIDTTTFSSIVIASPSVVGASIDAINLAVDPSNTFLIFINKKDGALWSLDLRP